MLKLAIISRPITDSSKAYLLLEKEDHSLEKYALNKGDSLHITITDPSKEVIKIEAEPEQVSLFGQ